MGKISGVGPPAKNPGNNPGKTKLKKMKKITVLKK